MGVTAPFLSICIPTYNRASQLNKLLESIHLELSSIHTQLVEVIVSDNASIDATEEVVYKWNNKFLIKYIKHHQNQGPDLNMLCAAKMAAGEYIWWIGDDDVILTGAFSTILPLLSQSPTPLCLLSKENDNHNYQNTHTIKTYNQTTDSHAFLIKNFTNMPLGSVIIKKILPMDHPLLKPGINSLHFYAYYICQSLGHANGKLPILILDGPIIKWAASTNKWYYPKLYEIYYQKTPKLIKNLHPFFDSIKPTLQNNITTLLSNGVGLICLKYSDSKIRCLRIMGTYPIPLTEKIKLITSILFQYLYKK